MLKLFFFFLFEVQMISLAYANSAPGLGGLMRFVQLVIIFSLYYFMLIRPQMKPAQVHKILLVELKNGDEIMLASGILGKIEKVADTFVILQISDNTQIKVQKNSVLAVLSKGTIQSI